MIAAVLFGIATVCAVVAMVCGEIAGVTLWIPHAGTHGHAPTTLGYIALYSLFLALSAFGWTVIGTLAMVALEC